MQPKSKLTTKLTTAKPASLFVTLALILMLMVPWTYAQEPQNLTSPYAANFLGPQLIMWSQQQKPYPVPQPLPDPPEQRPEQRQEIQPAPSASNSTTQPRQVQTLTGRIVKDGSKFVWKTPNDRVYQLDDQQKAQPYDGRVVKLVGTVDEANATVRIVSIDLIS